MRMFSSLMVVLILQSLSHSQAESVSGQASIDDSLSKNIPEIGTIKVGSLSVAMGSMGRSKVSVSDGVCVFEQKSAGATGSEKVTLFVVNKSVDATSMNFFASHFDKIPTGCALPGDVIGVIIGVATHEGIIEFQTGLFDMTTPPVSVGGEHPTLTLPINFPPKGTDKRTVDVPIKVTLSIPLPDAVKDINTLLEAAGIPTIPDPITIDFDLGNIPVQLDSAMTGNFFAQAAGTGVTLNLDLSTKINGSIHHTIPQSFVLPKAEFVGVQVAAVIQGKLDFANNQHTVKALPTFESLSGSAKYSVGELKVEATLRIDGTIFVQTPDLPIVGKRRANIKSGQIYSTQVIDKAVFPAKSQVIYSK